MLPLRYHFHLSQPFYSIYFFILENFSRIIIPFKFHLVILAQIKKMANKTLMMIKPDAVENGHVGNILEKVTSAGFKIKALKLTQLTKRDAEAFYEVHNERPFFGELVSFMTRGPIVAALLEKENAVSDFRTLIGATNPAEAAEGTLRKLYATSMGENAVHGSDSDENASIEAAFHFSQRECF
jgi:nucleoside-diphosphate kinase